MSQPKINFDNLTHHFLVATPQMPDPRFDRAVIYVCRHDKQGMLGLVINEPFENTTISRLFEDLDIELKHESIKHELALSGGPVHPEVGFILHTGQPNWLSSFAISENISITTSRDILQSIAIDSSVTNFLMCLGHVVWGRKQILNEIKQGDWLVVPADLNLLFNAPFDERWQLAGEKIGVRMEYLSTEVGNA